MLELFELAPSPNNTKVRMALRWKGIEFRAIAVDPLDRSMVREVSGQDLTPVIRDRGVVLPDSEAILQFLDANHPDTRRLMPPDREGRRAADAFKTRLDRELAPSWRAVAMFAIGVLPELDPAAAGTYVAALAALDEELGDREHFSEAPIDDLRVATWATYALPSQAVVERVPVFGRTRELFDVAPDRLPNLRRFVGPWNERLA